MRNRHSRIPPTGAWRTFVLLTGVCLLLSACNGSGTLEMPEGVEALPNEHTASRLIADNASNKEIAEAAFTCHQGGSSAGPIGTCLVTDNGLLVIVPLTMPADVTAVITGSGFAQQFRVPLPGVSGNSLPDPEDLFAVPHEQGSIEVEFHHNDEPSGAAISGQIGP